MSEYWECATCGKRFSDAGHQHEIDVPVTTSALGHAWGAWVENGNGTVTRTCTRDTTHTETETIAYSLASGSGATWTQGSTDTLIFTFKRNYNDQNTFRHLTGILVDGKAVDASNYTAVEGSVVVTLKASYLATLAAGEHTLTAVFDDGNNPTATFTVKPAATTPASTTSATSKPGTSGTTAAPAGALPKTGDVLSAIPLVAEALAFAGIGTLALGSRLRRKPRPGRHTRR